MNPGFHCTGQDGRQRVWRREGWAVWFADVNVVDRVAHGGGGVMVWAGVMLWTTNTGMFYWWHFEWGPIVSAIHPRLSPHVCSMIMPRPPCCRICTNSWKLKTSQFLHEPAILTGHVTQLSMFGMLWIGVYDSVFRFLPISINFAQPLKRSGTTFHRPQSTTRLTLCEGDVLHCVRQMVVTPDTDWFSDPPQYSKTAHFCSVYIHSLATLLGTPC